MMISSRLLCLGLAAATLMAASAADARPRKRHLAYTISADRTINVTRRSFLDSGTQAPVGSRNAYVQEIIRFERPPLANTSPGILWRPDPGAPEPIF